MSPSTKQNTIDTVNFWHIYINKNKIKEFNEITKNNEIQLKRGSIKKKDSLKIKYFSDTNCSNCSYLLKIPTDEEISFYEISRLTKSISISIETFKVLFSNNKLQPLKVFLVETKGLLPSRAIELFTMKIE